MLDGEGCLELLRIQADTCFTLSESGRITGENEPVPSAGPRLYVTGCREGNVSFLREDVPDDLAEELSSFLRRQPPLPDIMDFVAAPLGDILSRRVPVTSVESSIVYVMANLPPPAATAFVCSDTKEGAALLDRWQRQGFPQHLKDSGFAAAEEFWPPWCVAFEGKEAAATAFAARLGQRGAEVGIVTFPRFRGRGLAAAVTAKWAGLPQLGQRKLFYSTSTSNTASQRVAEKMGLERIGVGLRIT